MNKPNDPDETLTRTFEEFQKALLNRESVWVLVDLLAEIQPLTDQERDFLLGLVKKYGHQNDIFTH